MQFEDKNEAIQFLEKTEAKVKSSSEAFALCKVLSGQILLEHLGDQERTKVIIFLILLGIYFLRNLAPCLIERRINSCNICGNLRDVCARQPSGSRSASKFCTFSLCLMSQ